MKEIIAICCVCGKIRLQLHSEWIKARIPNRSMLTHSYCDECFKIELKKIEEDHPE